MTTSPSEQEGCLESSNNIGMACTSERFSTVPLKRKETPNLNLKKDKKKFLFEGWVEICSTREKKENVLCKPAGLQHYPCVPLHDQAGQ